MKRPTSVGRVWAKRTASLNRLTQPPHSTTSLTPLSPPPAH